MSEVAYAGPAPSAAPAAPAPVTSSPPVEPAYTVTGRKVAVHVEADEPGMQLLVKAGQGVVSGGGYSFGGGGFVSRRTSSREKESAWPGSSFS
jgi:hypothetical protein